MKESTKGEALPVLLAADIQPQPPGKSWLIQNLWCHQAVGIVGGSPKSAKTWFGLDMAVSIASGTPCLGHFPVDNPGRGFTHSRSQPTPPTKFLCPADILIPHRLPFQRPDSPKPTGTRPLPSNSMF